MTLRMRLKKELRVKVTTSMSKSGGVKKHVAHRIGVESVSGATNIKRKFGVVMNRIDEHMIGIWQITTIPLKATLDSDSVVIEQPVIGMIISKIPLPVFLGLEPKEIVEIIDRDLSKRAGEPVSVLRRDFSGHKKNPFSSQN